MFSVKKQEQGAQGKVYEDNTSSRDKPEHPDSLTTVNQPPFVSWFSLI